MTHVDYSGVCHALTHVNEEKFAARTACGRYADFRPGEVDDGDEPVTCIACVVAPELDYREAASAQMHVDARRRDRIGRCRDTGSHLVYVHADGGCTACTACGYGGEPRVARDARTT